MSGGSILKHLVWNGRVLAVDLEDAEFKRAAAQADASSTPIEPQALGVETHRAARI